MKTTSELIVKGLDMLVEDLLDDALDNITIDILRLIGSDVMPPPEAREIANALRGWLIQKYQPKNAPIGGAALLAQHELIQTLRAARKTIRVGTQKGTL